MSPIKTILFLVALGSTISALGIDSEDIERFRNYGATFGKDYSSQSEFEYRHAIFTDRMNKIEEFNKGDNSFTKGQTVFTDLTEEERQKFTGLTLDSNAPKSALPKYRPPSFRPANSGERRLQDSTYLDSITPRAVDWNADGKVTSVKDQGACGSCWAFAVAAQLESYNIMFNDTTYDLSEQQLVDCSYWWYGNYGCQGGLNTTTWSYIYDRGITFEEDYPYNESQGFCKFWKTDRIYVNNVWVIPQNEFSTLIDALTYAPVTIAFYAPDDLFDYTGGVFDGVSLCDLANSPNHAVLAIGFDLDAETPYVYFKNQWGTGWGDNGYFKMNFLYEDYQNGPCNLNNHEEDTFAYDFPDN